MLLNVAGFVLVDLRSVPGLVNELAAPPLSLSEPSPVISKRPALLIEEPFCRKSTPLFPYVIVAVDAVVSVRLERKWEPAEPMVNVADGLIVVVPPPCIVPASHVAVLVSETVPVPSSVPPPKLNCGMATLPVPLSVPAGR